ncbi:hypothetical protein ACMD2_25887 [Ananas comosus]|uniref:Uncharacterized protein n=1 Tax=Ananas comosus TaxID=4615 RepID=A0A199V2R8_ANACO|nr:hypothetical protein ACMD2_25887 [Ananas comosus]
MHFPLSATSVSDGPEKTERRTINIVFSWQEKSSTHQRILKPAMQCSAWRDGMKHISKLIYDEITTS